MKTLKNGINGILIAMMIKNPELIESEYTPEWLKQEYFEFMNRYKSESKLEVNENKS